MTLPVARRVVLSCIRLLIPGIVLLAAAGEGAPALSVGERVEVAVDAAAMKVRHDVVAALKRGDQATVERLWNQWLWTTVEVGGERRSGWVRIDQVRRIAPAELPPLDIGDEVAVVADEAEVAADGKSLATLSRRFMFIVEAVRQDAVATTVDVAGKPARGWVRRASVRRIRPGEELPVAEGDRVVVTAERAPVIRDRQTIATLSSRYVFTVEAARPGEVATTVDVEGRATRGWVDARLVRRATPRDLPERIRLWKSLERPLCTLALDKTVRESLAVSPDGWHVAYAERTAEGQRVTVDGQPGPIHAEIGHGTPLFSPSGNRVAYTALADGRWRVVVDNFAGPPFDRVAGLTFSADGRRVAYAARKRDQWLLVLDGQPGPPCDAIDPKTVVLSPNGRHAACAAKRFDKWAVVLDGERGEECDEVRDLLFSSDGGRLLYLGRLASRWHVVVDGRREPGFEAVLERRFSADGRRSAYVARAEGRLRVVVDGVVGPPCDGVLEGTPVFSPDGRRVAYGLVEGETARAVIDGQAGPAYQGIAGLAFSPDSRRVAYAAQKGARWHVVVDGAEGLPYDAIAKGTPVFSPDSRRVAFVARVGARSVAVLDGQPGPEHDGVLTASPLFSPDGRHVAYVVVSAKTWRVVHDGEPGPPCDAIGAGTPVFSPDSRRMACIAVRDGRWRLTVNGEPGSAWDELSDVTFSPDGRHLACMARRDTAWRILLDGEPGRPYGGLLAGSRLIVTPAGARYLAWTRRGDSLRVLRVQHVPNE